MNNILILDIGNSLIKISLTDYKNEKIIFTDFFETKEFSINKSKIKKKFLEINYDFILIGSVVPSISNLINKLIPKNKKKYFIKNEDFNFLNFKSKVNINDIGMDILSFANFLLNKTKDSIGISFGTAIFSIIIKNNVIIGINIAPSIDFAFNELKNNTELINEINIKEPKKNFGLDNISSIESGYYHLLNGFLKSILDFSFNKYNIKNVFINNGKKILINKEELNENLIFFLNYEQIVIIGYLFLFKKINYLL